LKISYWFRWFVSLLLHRQLTKTLKLKLADSEPNISEGYDQSSFFAII